jgi:hypothetical protein
VKTCKTESNSNKNQQIENRRKRKRIEQKKIEREAYLAKAHQTGPAS